MNNSKTVIFTAVVVLALCCCTTIIYYLWSSLSDTDDDLIDLYDDDLMGIVPRSMHQPPIVDNSTPTQPSTTELPSKTTETQVNFESHRNYKYLFQRCDFLDPTRRRVIGGSEAELLANPWIVLLYTYFSDTQRLEPNCAGTLISENLVLTAAHCVKGQTISKIRLGEHNLLTDPDCAVVDGKKLCADPIQEIEDYEIVTHKNYIRRITVDYDIALIKLKKPANIQQNNIKPICLPFYGTSNWRSDTKFTVIGFGRTLNGSSSDVLLTAEAPYVPIKECQEKINEKAEKPYPLDHGHICAGDISGDAQKGDSGGPLQRITQVGRKAAIVQYGIVSGGLKAVGRLPGIYTNVTYFLDWILDNADPLSS